MVPKSRKKGVTSRNPHYPYLLRSIYHVSAAQKPENHPANWTAMNLHSWRPFRCYETQNRPPPCDQANEPTDIRRLILVHLVEALIVSLKLVFTN